MDDVRPLIERVASEVGFHVVRFASFAPTPTVAAFDAWLASGLHADMDWLARSRDVRADARLKLRSARGVVVLAITHPHRRPPDPGGRTGLVARYAWGRDYHNLVDKRLKKLKRVVRAAGVECWGGVDTAPILERAWAQASGLGFTGKNGVQLLPGNTSWLVLAVLFVTAPVTPDPPLSRDHCGACTRCLVGCPTDAFVGPRSLDAGRCISYWTIEARGLPPRALRPAFGRWVLGCDVCQEVCPHNGPDEPDEPDLLPRNAWLDLDALILADDAALDARFVGTPLARPGAVGMKRNALIALGNLDDDGGVPAARHALGHADPVVRGAAVWCLSRLGDHAAAIAHTDPHPLVRAEQQQAPGA